MGTLRGKLTFVSIVRFGHHFDKTLPLYAQQEKILSCVFEQIEEKWPNNKNLVISTTWLGSAFYENWQNLLSLNEDCDNLFYLSIVDPCYLQDHEFSQIEQKFSPNNVYKIGLGFPDDIYINISVMNLHEEGVDYKNNDLLLKSPVYRFVNYNRKPKPHRVDLVEKIKTSGLLKHGIVTLGANDPGYDVSEGRTFEVLTLEENHNNFDFHIEFDQRHRFSGIPLDLSSLGSLETWQNHFLNVVSETEFYPWDRLLVSEKTWKPILGLRPFIINGQNTMYQWLRNQGFKTFNQYWPFANLESCNELEIHDEIIKVLQYICSLSNKEIIQLYEDMLPDLLHNKTRLQQYTNETYQRLQSLF
jgi:hypothetical protein